MASSTVGALLRTEQAFCSQVCDKQVLEFGIAYYSDRFAVLPEANQYREVTLDSPSQVELAFDEAEAWFSQRNLCFHRWASAGGAGDDSVVKFLAEKGFQRRTYHAMTLAERVSFKPFDNVRVLHARAVRDALRQTFLQPSDDPSSPQSLQAAACTERLDDPQFDMYVALVDKVPAGRCALYQVGDIARVMDLTVLPAFKGQGVDHVLTKHVLTQAHRLAIRKVCVQVDCAQADREDWFRRAGFLVDGVIDAFDRTPTALGES